MRLRGIALGAMIADFRVLRTVLADPLTIRSGWVVMTSGYKPMVLDAKDRLKHYLDLGLVQEAEKRLP